MTGPSFTTPPKEMFGRQQNDKQQEEDDKQMYGAGLFLSHTVNAVRGEREAR
jgi:hypothetical protein